MCYDEKWRANIDQRNVAVTFIFKRSIVWLAGFLVSSSNRSRNVRDIEMAYQKIMTVFLCILVVSNLWHNVSAKGGGEITANPQMRLCGEEILAVHQAYCEQKLKRDVNDQYPIKNSKVIQEDLALSFLVRKSREARHLSGWYSNANEECCHETCSLEEVAEYRCT